MWSPGSNLACSRKTPTVAPRICRSGLTTQGGTQAAGTGVLANSSGRVGGSLIVPQGWLDQQQGQPVPEWAANAEARQRIEQQAMSAVLEHERALGNDPLDVPVKTTAGTSSPALRITRCAFWRSRAGWPERPPSPSLATKCWLRSINPGAGFWWSFLWTGSRPMAHIAFQSRLTVNPAGPNPASTWT